MTDLVPDISVVVCTRNRAESLGLTLECLASANREGICAEVIVVDNAGADRTREIAESFASRIPIRYLYEPKTKEFGKCHALNCALDSGHLGEIIAILDDDMSPDPNWFRGAMALCNRWPDKDIFTGNTFIIWPSESVPAWAKKPSLQSWIFSSYRTGDADTPLREGWYSGNHFWFRSRALASRKRFKDIWITEGDFQLDLVELGFEGVAGADAIAGHRIQPELLRREVVLERAKITGACMARLRVQPGRKKVKQARMFAEHPLAARMFCALNYLRWRALFFVSYFHPSDAGRFEHKLIALERMSAYREYLRAANQSELPVPEVAIRAD
jgi:glycosyltransferase involved in cell wall biosynthesis